jgi:hypothetical protein
VGGSNTVGASGNVWLFGGYEGPTLTTRVEMNDLWKYPYLVQMTAP